MAGNLGLCYVVSKVSRIMAISSAEQCRHMVGTWTVIYNGSVLHHDIGASTNVSRIEQECDQVAY